MKQKTRIASKLFAALVVLTLISCCFLGTTMARYTSKSSGKASISVATWNVAVTNTQQTTAVFDALSPDKDAYQGGDSYVTNNVRTHDSDPELLLTVVNSGEVAANITVGYEAPTYENAEGSPVTTFGDDDTGELSMDGVFTIQLYYGTAPTWDNSYLSNTITNNTQLTDSLAADGGTIYIYGIVTWTSDTVGVFGPGADVRDTWIGQNIETVNWTLNCTAVQASELPTP